MLVTIMKMFKIMWYNWCWLSHAYTCCVSQCTIKILFKFKRDCDFDIIMLQIYWITSVPKIVKIYIKLYSPNHGNSKDRETDIYKESKHEICYSLVWQSSCKNKMVHFLTHRVYFCILPICMTLHLFMLNNICHSCDHCTSLLRSSWSLLPSDLVLIPPNSFVSPANFKIQLSIPQSKSFM